MPDSIPDPAAEPGRREPARTRRESRRGARRSSRDADRSCVCAHASPDGDALGSLLGLGLSLAATGRDVVFYQDGDEPFPRELAFLGSTASQRRVPADAAERTLIALDCGSAQRIDRRGEVAGQFARVVNIDHHHDNTLFGTVNLVDRRGLLHRRDRRRAAGRGGHPAGRRRAARALRRPGDRHRPLPVREHDAARAPPGRARCSRRACSLRWSSRRSSSRCRSRGSGCSAWRSAGPRSQRGGRLAVTWLGARRFRDRPARTTPPRTASSTRCARSRASSWRRWCASRATAAGRRARSRCAPAPAASTARRSRASGVEAATRAPPGSPRTSRSRRSWRSWSAAASAMNAAVLLVDKPAGPTSFGCVARVRGALGGRKVKVGHAGTLDPFATGLLALLVGRATRLAPYLVGLDKRYRDRRAVRRALRHRRSRRRARAGRRAAARRRRAARAPAPARRPDSMQVPPATSAIKVGGQRAYALARAGRAVELPPREVHIHALDVVLLRRGERSAPCSTCAARRAPTSARWRAISARRSAAARTAPSCGGWRSGTCEIERAGRSTRSPPILSAAPGACRAAMRSPTCPRASSTRRSATRCCTAARSQGTARTPRCAASPTGVLVCVAGPRGNELRSLVVVGEA